jgi:hypothetical protein
MVCTSYKKSIVPKIVSATSEFRYVSKFKAMPSASFISTCTGTSDAWAKLGLHPTAPSISRKILSTGVMLFLLLFVLMPAAAPALAKSGNMLQLETNGFAAAAAPALAQPGNLLQLEPNGFTAAAAPALAKSGHTLQLNANGFTAAAAPALAKSGHTLQLNANGFTAAAAPALAQSGWIARFLVTSADDGSPLTGASVLVFDAAVSTDVPARFCITDRDGFCEIRALEAIREYLLEIRYLGYTTHTAVLSGRPDERQILRVALELSTKSFDEVTVEERRYVTTGEAGLRRVGAQEIARIPSPVAGGDFAMVLQSMPGMVSAGDTGGELYIRGGTPDQNLFLVDGLQVIKPLHISNLFSAFPAGVLQSADVYAGGFPAAYGGATSAVMDIRLRPGNMRRFSANGSLSPYMLTLMAEGPVETDYQSILVSARTSVIEQTSPWLASREQPMRFSDLVVRYTVRSDEVTCGATGLFTHDEGETVPGRQMVHQWSNTVVGVRCLGYSEVLNNAIDLSFGYSGYANAEGTPVRMERESRLNQYILNFKSSVLAGEQPFDVGFSFHFQNYRVKLSERFGRFLDLVDRENNVPVIRLFGAAERELVTGLTVSAGLVTQFTYDVAVSFEPRARMVYRFGAVNRQEVSLAVGRYAQFHTAITDERDIGAVFTAYLPVRWGETAPTATHYIAGYQRALSRVATLHVEGFLKMHQHIPVSKWTPEARFEIETATARSRTHGLEVRLDRSGLRYHMSLAYGYSVSEYEAETDDLGAWSAGTLFRYHPAHDQRHALNLMAGYEFSGFRMLARWEMATGRPYTRVLGYDHYLRIPFQDPLTEPGRARILYSEPYGSRMPVYHRLDVSISREIRFGSGASVEFSAGVINTYDRRNVYSLDLATLTRVDQMPFFPYVSLKSGF